METTEKLKVQNAKAKKMMLWFGIGSICMTFAGLSSAYIVSSKRADWLTQIELPLSFTISTAIIILSSFSIYYSRKMLQENKLNLTKYFLIITLILSFLFILVFEKIIKTFFSSFITNTIIDNNFGNFNC